MTEAVRVEADNRTSECSDAFGHLVGEGALPCPRRRHRCRPERVIEIVSAQWAGHLVKNAFPRHSMSDRSRRVSLRRWSTMQSPQRFRGTPFRMGDPRRSNSVK